MKTAIKRIAVILLAISMTFCFAACQKKGVDKTGAWSTAIYTSDTELGEGEKTLTVKVEAEEQSITFTIKTDAATVGEALLEHEIIDGEEGPYGMYIKAVNGIVADYDTDQTYWAFNKGGEYMMTGVDQTELADGDSYELVKTKG